MNYSSVKEKININFIFLFILSLYYLIPYFFVGQLIVSPHDTLDGPIVYNHIIGKIYRGDHQSINLLIGGEIKWYFLRAIFQPLTLLYGLFDSETAFWLNHIVIKLTCYICLFKLCRKLNSSLFNSALIASLFAASIDTWTHLSGLSIPAFPYLVYLLVKNKNLNLKHYFFIALIGLHTDLFGHVLIIPILFLVFLVLCSQYQNYNFKLFFKIAFILLFFIFLSNSHLIYAQLFSETFHRTEIIHEATDFNSNFIYLILSFFGIPEINKPNFFQSLPFTLYILPIVIISLFSKNKTTYLLLLIVFFIFFMIALKNSEFAVSIRNNVSLHNPDMDLFGKITHGIVWMILTLHWWYMAYLIPAIYGLLFISTSNLEILKKTKYLVYPLLILSLITSQVRISIIPLGKHFISFDNLEVDQKKQLRESFYNKKYTLLIKNSFLFKKNESKNYDKNFKSRYTFKGFYDYENYKYIKSIVLDSRTISIGLDPMAAVMNNMKVLDGYHNIYPLSYKYKFRRIIEEQLNHYPEYKEYYDGWGQRIYTFVFDPEVIKINFREAKLLGAEYVISKYQISSQELLAICEKCNDSPELFLYKIKI